MNASQQTPATDTPKPLFTDADIISVYTTEQGIEDGIFVDVTEWARESGIRWQTIITRNLFDTHIDPDNIKDMVGQDARGRAHDVFTVFRYMVKSTNEPFLAMKVRFQTSPARWKDIIIWATVNALQTGEPVLTFMLPEDY